MRNGIVTIVGMKGSGKTSLAKRLVLHTPRVVVIDRFLEYEHGAISTDFHSAVDYLATNWNNRFRLLCRFTSDLHNREILRFIGHTAQHCPTAPISIVVEEADFFASPQYIEPSLQQLYHYGRHFRVNLLAIARGDTDLHRSILGNSDIIVSFRLHKVSAAMRDRFSKEDIQRLLRLDTLTPQDTPLRGKHFLCSPVDGDPVTFWHSFQALEEPPKKG